RCRLLMHMVDMAPVDDSDPAENVRIIAEELQKFSPTLASRQRWLLLNKIDLLPPDEVDARCQAVIDALNWTGPVFRLSALQRNGTELLAGRIRDHLEAVWEEASENRDAREREMQLQLQMAEAARDGIGEEGEAYRAAQHARGAAADEFNDGDYEVEV